MRFTTTTITRLLAALLILCLPLSTAAADTTGLIVGVVSNSTVALNPLRPVEREMRSITALVYEGLVKIGDDNLPAPCLAERWEFQGSSFSFTLREGLQFSDGTPVTASDVAASLNEILRLADDPNNPNKGAYASIKYVVGGVTVKDQRNLSIKTGRQNFGFLYAMTFPVLPESQVQADNPVGTGPYVVNQFTPKSFLLLSTNSLWWNGRPKVPEVMVSMLPENRELLSAYEYNRVDAIISRSLNAAQLKGGSNSMALTFRTPQLETLLMNNRAPELEDVRVRKAIRHLLPIEALIRENYMGMAVRANTPLTPGSAYYYEAPDQFFYDVERAKSLLAEAGWADSDGDGILDRQVGEKKRNLRLRFVVYEEPDTSVRVNVAHRISEVLASVGIKADATAMTYQEVREKLKAGSFDLALCAFNVDQIPDPGFLLMTGNTGNFGRYSNKAMDEHFKNLRKSLEKENYVATLRQIQQLFAEDCPFICLYYRSGALLTRRMFTNARDIREPEVLRGVEDQGGQ